MIISNYIIIIPFLVFFLIVYNKNVELSKPLYFTFLSLGSLFILLSSFFLFLEHLGNYGNLSLSISILALSSLSPYLFGILIPSTNKTNKKFPLTLLILLIINNIVLYDSIISIAEMGVLLFSFLISIFIYRKDLCNLSSLINNFFPALSYLSIFLGSFLFSLALYFLKIPTSDGVIYISMGISSLLVFSLMYRASYNFYSRNVFIFLSGLITLIPISYALNYPIINDGILFYDYIISIYIARELSR